MNYTVIRQTKELGHPHNSLAHNSKVMASDGTSPVTNHVTVATSPPPQPSSPQQQQVLFSSVIDKPVLTFGDYWTEVPTVTPELMNLMRDLLSMSAPVRTGPEESKRAPDKLIYGTLAAIHTFKHLLKLVSSESGYPLDPNFSSLFMTLCQLTDRPPSVLKSHIFHEDRLVSTASFSVPPLEAGDEYNRVRGVKRTRSRTLCVRTSTTDDVLPSQDNHVSPTPQSPLVPYESAHLAPKTYSLTTTQ